MADPYRHCDAVSNCGWTQSPSDWGFLILIPNHFITPYFLNNGVFIFLAFPPKGGDGVQSLFWVKR